MSITAITEQQDCLLISFIDTAALFRKSRLTSTQEETPHDRFTFVDLFERPLLPQLRPFSWILLTAFIGHFTLGSSSQHQTAYSFQTQGND